MQGKLLSVSNYGTLENALTRLTDWARGCMPVTLTLWEADRRGPQVQTQPGKLSKTLFQKKNK